MKKATSNVGVKSVAVDMGLSASLVYKWCQPKELSGGADNPLDRVKKVCDITEDNSPVEWLCRERGGYFVKSPETEKEPPRPLLRVTQEILSEFSTLLENVSRSIENDGIIDNAEAEQIRRNWEKLKSVGETFVASCEDGVYGS